MLAVLNIVLLIVAALAVPASIYYIARALTARRAANRRAYGVGRQEARHQMFLLLARAVFLGFVGLLAFGIVGVSALPGGILAEPEPTPTSTARPTERPTATQTGTPTPLPVPQTPRSSPTSPLARPTDPPTPTPSVTPTPRPPVATVNTPAGVYLRGQPNLTSPELELLPNGTELFLLPGRESVNEIDWQQVEAPSGATGWVAADFLLYPEDQ